MCATVLPIVLKSTGLAKLLQNSRSVPWLVLGSAARHGDHSTSDPPPGIPRSSWRRRTHNPPPKFSCFELTTGRDAQRSPNAGSRSVSGVACAVLIRTVCADSARVACALFSLPRVRPAEMPATHHRAPEAISAGLRNNCVSMCVRLMPSKEKANPATRAGSTHHSRLNFLEQAHEFLDKALYPASSWVIYRIWVASSCELVRNWCGGILGLLGLL